MYMEEKLSILNDIAEDFGNPRLLKSWWKFKFYILHD